MPRDTPSPIDLPAHPIEAAGLGWTTVTIVVACLLLLACNAVSLRDWIEDLPPGPLQARAAAAAEAWAGATAAIGFAAPRDTLHAAWKRIEAARFDGAADGDASAPDQR